MAGYPARGFVAARFSTIERKAILVGMGLVALVGAILFFGQEPLEARHRPWTGPHIGSDGWYYYHNLRSLVLDGDFDLTNEYRKFGNWYGFGRSRIGRPRNPFGVGPAIAWMPAFFIGHLIAKARNSSSPHLKAHGYSPIEQGAALTTTFLAGVFTILLCYVLCRRIVDPLPAALGTFAATLGGPLVWYSLYEPAMPHALAAFFTTAFLLATLRLERPMTTRRAVFAGFLCGMAMLMRPQLVFLLLVPGTLWGGEIWALRSEPRELMMRCGVYAAVVAAALVTFLPQMVFWKSVYGALWVVPQGSGFLRLGESLWPATLFSSRNGLFVYTPVLWFTMAGCVILLRRHGTIAAGLVLFVLTQMLINGAVWDWWAGGAYSGRRYTACTPLFALFLGALIDSLFARYQAKRIVWSMAIVVIASFLVYQGIFLCGYRRKWIRWDSAQPLFWKARSRLAVLPHAVYRIVGNPFSFPASAWFAIRHGVPLERYDAVTGAYLLSERLQTTNPRRKIVRRQVISLRGSARWRERYQGRGWRLGLGGLTAMSDEVELFLPLNRPGGLLLDLEFREIVPAKVGLTINGYSPLVARRGKRLVVNVTQDAVTRGVNVVRAWGLKGAVLLRFILREGNDWPAEWVKEAP